MTAFRAMVQLQRLARLRVEAAARASVAAEASCAAARAAVARAKSEALAIRAAAQARKQALRNSFIDAPQARAVLMVLLDELEDEDRIAAAADDAIVQREADLVLRQADLAAARHRHLVATQGEMRRARLAAPVRAAAGKRREAREEADAAEMTEARRRPRRVGPP